jgi:hypothetical protein
VVRLVIEAEVFFGTTLWATDARFPVLILASLGLCLFLVTALFGSSLVWLGLSSDRVSGVAFLSD